MTTYLDRILERHRRAATEDRRSLASLLELARAVPQRQRGFTTALWAGAANGLAVIAEVKRRSPSRGDLAVDLDPAALAGAYVAGGASCLSVLTDAEFFGGSTADLRAAREAVAVPVLRKDFTIEARDVCDTRLMGADAVLLIVAALDDAELADLHALSTELGLDVLVEIHDEAELQKALAVGATAIGVNQRDLTTFEVDNARAVRVAGVMPEGVLRVAESGIRGPSDAAELADAGFHAVLVGESLVTAGDPAGSVASLRTPRR